MNNTQKLQVATDALKRISMGASPMITRAIADEAIDILAAPSTEQQAATAGGHPYGYVLKTGHGNSFRETLDGVAQEARHMWVAVDKRGTSTVAQAAPAGDAIHGLHDAIMRLPCNTTGMDATHALSCKLGHRDARHAAAELVAEYEGRPIAATHPIAGLGSMTNEDDGTMTLQFKDEDAAQEFMSRYSPTVDCRDMPERAATQPAGEVVPKIVLALPDYEKRKIVIASDEMIDGERMLCVAIQDGHVAPSGSTEQPHWIDGEQAALGGRTAREGYAANPDYSGSTEQPAAASVDGLMRGLEFENMLDTYAKRPDRLNFHAIVGHVREWGAQQREAGYAKKVSAAECGALAMLEGYAERTKIAEKERDDLRAKLAAVTADLATSRKAVTNHAGKLDAVWAEYEAFKSAQLARPAADYAAGVEAAAQFMEARAAKWEKEAQRHLPHWNSECAKRDFARRDVCSEHAYAIRTIKPPIARPADLAGLTPVFWFDDGGTYSVSSNGLCSVTLREYGPSGKHNKPLYSGADVQALLAGKVAPAMYRPATVDSLIAIAQAAPISGQEPVAWRWKPERSASTPKWEYGDEAVWFADRSGYIKQALYAAPQPAAKADAPADTGQWLSSTQAVMPDGSQRDLTSTHQK